VIVRGGEWEVTYPASCRLTCELMYLPQNADADGWGTLVEREVEDWIAAAAQADPWLREHPPSVAWGLDIPPSEVDAAHPLVPLLQAASAEVGEPASLGGLDSWFDAATFTRFGATPCLGYGPRSIGLAHTIDEHVPVDDLVRCAQGLALAAMRWCGVS
jgi:acetylornithine deacetylase